MVRGDISLLWKIYPWQSIDLVAVALLVPALREKVKRLILTTLVPEKQKMELVNNNNKNYRLFIHQKTWLIIHESSKEKKLYVLKLEMVECSKMISYFPMFLFAFPIPGSQIADPDPQHCTACLYRLAQKPLNYYINMERCSTIKLES